MGIIITYDVPNNHLELKNKMIAMGYSKTIKDNLGKLYNLPNTTLYKSGITVTQAYNDLKACANNLTEIERCMAVEFNTYVAIPGKPL